jgi:hypothetical protein
MASPNVYSGGLNLTGTVFAGGPSLATLGPVYLSGLVQWLDTINGNDSNAGSTPELPVKTILQAATNFAAAPNGVIVIGQGSQESIAVSQTNLPAGVMVMGCGIGAQRPRYTCSGAVDMFAVTAAGVRFRNLYFPASTAVSTSRISFAAVSGQVKDCYFECGASDTVRAVKIHTGANNTEVTGTSFVTTASRPAIGVEFSAAASDCRLKDCIFDGGSFGWSDYALKVTVAATRLDLENVSLVRRSDLYTVTATTYQGFGVTSDGTNRMTWTA